MAGRTPRLPSGGTHSHLLRPNRAEPLGAGASSAGGAPDVFMHRRTLNFASPMPTVDRQRQLERAAALLRVVRTDIPASIEATPSEPVPGGVEAEPAGPTGKTSYVDNPSFQKALTKLRERRPDANLEDVQLDDAGVVQLARDRGNKLMSGHLLGDDLPNHQVLALFRNFIRAGELGENIEILNANYVFTRAWEVNDETASVFKRAAKVFDIDERSIPYAGSTLDQYRSAKAPPPALDLQASMAGAPYDVMGSLAGYFPTMVLLESLAVQPELREGLRRFVMTAGLPGDLRSYLVKKLQLGPLDQAARVSTLRDRRSVAAAGEYIVEQGPLRTIDESGSNWDGLFANQRQKLILWATDSNLKTLERRNIGAWDVLKWGDNVYSPAPPLVDAVNINARRLELSAHRDLAAREARTQLLSGAITVGDHDMVMATLRYAQAAGVHPSDALVRSETGEIVSLESLADAFKVPRWPTRGKLDVGQLAQRALSRGEPLQARVDALADMQGLLPESPSFREVIAALRELLSLGHIERIDWAALDADQHAAVLKALGADAHPAAAAVLWGLLIDGGHDALFGLLESMTPGDAHQWRETASVIQQLGPTEQLFVTADLAQPPPDPSSLALRAALAGIETLKAPEIAALLKTHAGLGAPRGLRLMLEWAAMRGEDSFAEVKAVVEAGVAANTLTARDVAQAFSGGRGDALLDSNKVEALESLGRAALKASEAERGQALAALRSALAADDDSLTPSAELVAVMLTRLHQAERETTVGLDIADRELGGVSATHWHEARPVSERLYLDGPTWSDTTMSLEQARSLGGRAVEKLRFLQSRLAVKASRAAAYGAPVAPLAEAKAQAVELLTRELDLSGPHADASRAEAATVLLRDFVDGHEMILWQIEQLD